MPEPVTVTQPVAPAQATANVSTQAPVKEVKVEDIVSRASSVAPEKKSDEITPESIGFDRKKHEEVLAKLSPEMRASVENYQKELFAGVNKKFQEAAELKKQVEATSRRPKVSDLLQDPDFIREAQGYLSEQQRTQGPNTQSTLSDQEWSALTPQEQEQFRQMQQVNQNLQGQVSTLLRNQEDERIKERFKNYDPHVVSQLQQDLMGGRIQATREHLWKVVDYEDAIKRAYKLGLEDKQATIEEKKGASTTVNGVNMVATDDVPVKQPNESFSDYWRKIATRRLKQREQSLAR